MSLEPKPAADASLSQLMSELSSQTSRLVRDEMRLRKRSFRNRPSMPGSVPDFSAWRGCSRYLGSQ
jgi:hypothetical protein